MASQESKDSAAANQAAAVQQQTTKDVLQFLKDVYAQQREDQLPWLQTGASALQKQAYLMGLSGANHLRGGTRWTDGGGGLTVASGTSRPYRGDEGDGGSGFYSGDDEPPTSWSRRPGGVAGPAPNEFSRGYASNPLALITGMGRRPAGGGMVRLMAPTGEMRSVSAAQAPYYLAKGAKPA